MRWLLALAVCAACKQQADPPPPPNPKPAKPTMPAIEAKRARDACQAYVDKVCACAETVPAMKQPCSRARALPDAIQTSLEVGASDDATRRDAQQTQGAVRNIVKECIEELAKLPAAGCP
ncbi:MAG TPA: hypothetical protein VF469_06340 [Kofleriaceae bacterium]